MINLQRINDEIAELEEKLDMLHAARREMINRGNLNKASTLDDWHMYDGHTGIEHFNGKTLNHPVLPDGSWITITAKEKMYDNGNLVGVVSQNGQVFYLGKKLNVGTV